MGSKTKTAAKEEATPALAPKLRFPEFREAEGWAVKPFDELFTVGNGRDYKHLEAGDVPVYGSGGYMLSVNDYLYNGESVCIGRKGTIDNPMFLTGRFWTVDTLFYTHSFKDCLPKFIFAIFQQIDWLKHNEAGGVPSLSKTNIQKIHTAVPKPAEQQKIAECLTSVDDLIDSQARKLDALKTHKKGLMQHLFPREGETQPRLRFPEFQNAGEWVEQKLEDLASAVSDRAVTGAGDNVLSLSGEHGLVLQSDYFDKKVAGDKAERYLKLLRDDFVYNDRTTKASPYGTIKRLSKYSGGIVSPIYKCFRFNADENPVFWEWYFESGTHEGQLAGLVNEGARAGRFNISISQFLSSAVWRPNKPEQNKIADCLLSLDALLAAHARKLDALKTHKKALMQQLFPSPEEVDA